MGMCLDSDSTDRELEETCQLLCIHLKLLFILRFFCLVEGWWWLKLQRWNVSLWNILLLNYWKF